MSAPAAGRPPATTKAAAPRARLRELPRRRRCPGAYKYLQRRPLPAATAPAAIVMRLRCGAGELPQQRRRHRLLHAAAPPASRSPTPARPPSRSPAARCSAAAGRAARQTLIVDANDNSGIQEYRAPSTARSRARSRCRVQLRAEGAVPERAADARGPDRRAWPTARTRSAREAVDASGNAGAVAADDLDRQHAADAAAGASRSTAARAGARSDDGQAVAGRIPPQAPRRSPARATACARTLADERDADDARRGRAGALRARARDPGTDLNEIDDLELPGPGLVGPAAVADRRRRQPAARQRRRARRPRLRRHAARATSPSCRPDPQDPARVHVQRQRPGVRARRRRDRGPPRRHRRLAAAADPGRRASGLTRVRGRRDPAQGPVLPARPRRQRGRPGGLHRPRPRRAARDGQAADPARQPPQRRPPRAPHAARGRGKRAAAATGWRPSRPSASAARRACTGA